MKDFVNWVEENNKDYERYLQLVESLESFLSQEIITDKEISKHILNNFINVLANCDDITYDEPGMEYAYVILHFIERYRRFQIIILSLMKDNIIKSKDVYKFLDIGTGPAPAIFAFSDIVSLYNEYSAPKSDIAFEPDYVEMSRRFRNWLHHFVEYLWTLHGAGSYKVPFHHGNFYDFKNIEFNQKKYKIMLNGYEHIYRRDVSLKHRYNIVFYSNFLTSLRTVERFEEQIIETARWSLNDTVIGIIGASGRNSGKYAEAYEKLDRILVNKPLGNHNFVAYTYKVENRQDKYRFSYADKYGKRLKEFYSCVYELFNNYVNFNDFKQCKDIFEKVIDKKYLRVNSWQVHLYKKHSHLRT